MKRSSPQMWQCSRELALHAQLISCLPIWTSSAPVHHRHGVLHKPRQDWMSSWELASEAPDENKQNVFAQHLSQPSQRSLPTRCSASRTKHPLLSLDSHTCQLQRCRCGFGHVRRNTRDTKSVCSSDGATSFFTSALSSTSSSTAGPLLLQLPPSCTGSTPAPRSSDNTSRNSSPSGYGNSL